MKGILWLALPEQFSPVEPIYQPAKHLHVTLQFGVEFDQVSHLIGKEVVAFAESNCYNDRVQALTILLPQEILILCNNENPHLTISHREGVRPVESNEMLKGEHKSLDFNQVIFTVAEFKPFSGAPSSP